jgi:hypothetical protein
MPGPVFQGRCVVEIDVPQKTVCQNECERCERTWLTDSEDETPKVIVRFVERGARVIDCSYDVLCESCAKTVANLLKALARDMKKKSPQSEAKKEGASALPGSTPSATDPDGDRVRTSGGGVVRSSPSGPSTRS